MNLIIQVEISQDPLHLLPVLDFENASIWFKDLAERVLVAMEITLKIDTIRLRLIDMDGVADTSSHGNEKHVRMSFTYLSNHYRNSQRNRQKVKYEMMGVLAHELVHVFQSNGHGKAPHGWIEGYADYIRLKMDLSPEHWIKSRGGSFANGYSTSGYFLHWIECFKWPGFTYRVNGYLVDNDWDQTIVFSFIENETLESLWAQYQESFEVSTMNMES